MNLINEQMSSAEAQNALWDYYDKHHEIPDSIMREYKEITQKIVRRELKEHEGCMTEYPLI